MILAYCISAQDDDSYMLGENTYKPKESAGFYDWRFGKNGIPHPATCAICGRKTDPDYVNPMYRVKKRKRDITATYDGYLIASKRFRDICLEYRYQGVEFISLPSDADFYWLRSNRIIRFDAERRSTRFEKYCANCKAYFDVVGATPVYLKGIDEPLSEGFYRSDLEFASGHEQQPLIIVGVETANQLRQMKLRGFELSAVNK